jgi:DNA adenine methylase
MRAHKKIPTRPPSPRADKGLRPFLKWAGGKRQLLPQLRRFVPKEFGSYHEPFVGSGAVFFDLWDRGKLDSRGARLVDTNADLIGCYKAVVRDVEAVIRHLRRLAMAHAESGSEHYYRVRDELFNPTRRAREIVEEYPADLAAVFIYLNRTGFNGLYRLNAGGAFNVPAGRYANPQICDADNLRQVAHALGAPGILLVHGGFESVSTAARPHDFVYFDPPYAPLSMTARFTNYTADGFSADDQRRLRDVACELAHRGCAVVVSNSTAPIIKQLYERDPQALRAGFRAYRVPAKRAINSDASRRGAVMEYIVSNVQPEDR